MRKKRFICIALILAILSTSIFAAGQKEPTKTTEEKTKITFSINKTPILTSDFWNIVSSRYMEQNPNVVIENVGQPSSNIMHRDFLKTLLATNQFPDVMVMASPGDFVGSGALMPLPVEKMPYLKDTSIGKIDGENYVAVYKIQVGGFWYNRTAFENLGLDAPKTYDELINISKTIKKNNLTPVSMGLKDGWAHSILASMICSADILSEDPDWGLKRNRNEVKFSDRNFVRSIEKYQELTSIYSNSDSASVSYAQQLELFFSGKALMIPMGSWIQGTEATINPDFEVGFFPVPSDMNADSIAVWANEGLAIYADTKYPEQCLDFIRFFFEDELWYGQFLQTEMLFSGSQKEIPYKMSPLRKEVGAKFEALNNVENWFDMTGDAALLPGLQAYFNKMTQRITMGSDVKSELKKFDAEWDFVNSNM